IHGPVSRVIKVPSEYAVAIETALGAAMQNIVTGTEDDAKRAIAFLKQRDAGRATFLPMSTIKGSELKENGLDSCQGFVGVASTLCSCDEQYGGILRSLLGRICIATDLDSAVNIAKRYSYRFRVVTLDGQVVNAGGSLTGGSLNRKTGLLSRVSEIEKEKKAAAAIAENAEKAKQLFIQSQADYGSIEAKLTSARTALSEAQEDKFRIEAECRSSEEQLRILNESIADLNKEKAECAQRETVLTEALSKAEGELEKLEREMNLAKGVIESLSGQLHKQGEMRDSLTQRLQDIKLETVTIEKDIEALNSEIENAESIGSNQEIKRKEILEETEFVKKQISETEKKIRAAKDEETTLKMAIAENNQKIVELSEKRAELEKRSSQLRQLERDKSAEKENVGKELARLEERKLNLNKQYDDIISKLWDEYELTRRQAEEEAEKIENISAAQKRLSELKSKIKALGSVNVAAIDEYKEVAERYEFMKNQVGDVEKSKKEIILLIGDLTKQMKEIFIERFALINKNFGETFTELFGGGKASLSLTNEEDILNSGIDINCHPPGKIVSHLESLSGGERALVAIALYFAIMKVSPAPFCVMDEIEAALDEVNVDRFAQYLRRMNDNTQFILITHRRGTMEEADVLYGVTMQDEGISKLLELHTTEVAAGFTNLR
ncbi:MAG: chromosome segregation protein SMC, partial [Lachnospiraceae bacterium]|nr:chromosome segregation protein SMC [Lachnospiraceae bacterium]